jgi:hypothetical protein
MSYFDVKSITVATSAQGECGLLVMVEKRLVAVVTRLDEGYYGEAAGKWFLEAGFGLCAAPAPEPFLRPSDALRWIADHLEPAADISIAELAAIDRTQMRGRPVPALA